MPVPLPVMLLAWAVTALAAGIQGVVGMGFAVLSVPVLSLVDPTLAPVPQLLVTLPLTLSMAWRERHAMDISGIGWIVAGRFPGAAAGVALLKVASDRALDALIAVTVLSVVALTGAGIRLRRTPATKFGVGVFSGVSALIASIGGPPVALLYRDSPGDTIRSSLAAVFTFGITITLGARIVSGEITATDVQVALWIFPALVLGVLSSNRLRHYVEGPPLRAAILILSTLAAVGLLARSVAG
jgi:uncharacterized protein